MEGWIRIMKRMMLVFIAGLLALTAAAAMAEAADAEWTEDTYAATASAEETCAHEHTVTAYYFDAPEYFPLDGNDHLVVGAAIAEVTCQDCGAVISVTQESNAQETRSHVFRNGVCALCGFEAAMFEEPEKTASGSVEESTAEYVEESAEEWVQEDFVPGWTPAPARESVLSLPAGKDDPDQYTCMLTGFDLETAGDTLVLLPDGRNAAIVVKTDELRREIDGTGTFVAQIGKPGDWFISTSIRLYDAYGAETAANEEDISLRIYAENTGMPLTVAFTDAFGNTSLAESRWADEGYWVVNWCGDGMYSYSVQ